MSGLRPAEPKARGGQSAVECLLMIAAVLVVVAIAVYFITYSEPEPTIPQPTRYTIEGKIVDVEIGNKLMLTWENDDGTFAMVFNVTHRLLPIGEDIRLTYYIPVHSGFPSITNVEIKGAGT